MDKQRPTVQHKELCSMLPGSLDGRRAWERMNTLCVFFFLSSQPQTLWLTQCLDPGWYCWSLWLILKRSWSLWSQTDSSKSRINYSFHTNEKWSVRCWLDCYPNSEHWKQIQSHQWEAGLIDCDLSNTWFKEKDRDLAGGPVADSPLAKWVAQVQSPVGELDPTCCS